MAAGGAAPRRDRILSAASREFAEHGFAGARIERIATAAGVNKQLLFHYFRSKEGLHAAALGSLLHRLAPLNEPQKQPSESLRRLIDQLSEATSSHPALLSLLASPAAAPERDEEASVMAGRWRSDARLQVRKVLEAGQRSGHFRDDLDLDAVSELVVVASLGWAVSGGRETAGHRESYVESFLKVITDYCSWH